MSDIEVKIHMNGWTLSLGTWGPTSQVFTRIEDLLAAIYRRVDATSRIGDQILIIRAENTISREAGITSKED